MANAAHVKRLMQDVEAWNKWHRETVRFVNPDLADADLRHKNLSGADLSWVSLHGANLSGAKLIGADLKGADLTAALLFGTNLTGADLNKVVLWGTIFADVDLSRVAGLDTCRHVGPSVLDYRTFQKSYPLPLSFLRGVGLPEAWIEYLPSLLDQAIRHYSCFISYSTEDQIFADRIHEGLQNNGVRCWFAPHDMLIGDKIWDEIDAAIRLRDKVLLILSERSIESDWVEDEVNKAFEEERKRGQTVLFPRRCRDGYGRGMGREAARAPHRRLPALEGARRVSKELRARAARSDGEEAVGRTLRTSS